MVERAIGAVFMSIGLLCVCYKGYYLFTGRVGFLPENHGREALSALLWGTLGNLLAAVALGLLLQVSIPAVASVAQGLCAARLTQTWWQTLVRSILCGILMYLAVSIYRDKQTISGILFCVPVFILMGFEHSVADMFYFAAAGGLFSLETLVYMAIVVVGNALGGLLLPCLTMLKPKEAYYG